MSRLLFHFCFVCIFHLSSYEYPEDHHLGSHDQCVSWHPAHGKHSALSGYIIDHTIQVRDMEET